MISPISNAFVATMTGCCPSVHVFSAVALASTSPESEKYLPDDRLSGQIVGLVEGVEVRHTACHALALHCFNRAPNTTKVVEELVSGIRSFEIVDKVSPERDGRNPIC